MCSSVSPPDRKRHSFIEVARRAQIIACAIDTIAELGYGQASLAKIAKRAEISKSVISYHFTNKDVLIQQVVNEIYATASASISPRIDAETTAAGVLRTFIEASAEFYRSHHKHMLVLMDIWANARKESGTHLDTTVHASELTNLEIVLNQGQQDGEFRAFSSRVMAVTVRQALNGLLLLLRDDPNLDLDAYTEELVTIFDSATRKAPR